MRTRTWMALMLVSACSTPEPPASPADGPVAEITWLIDT